MADLPERIGSTSNGLRIPQDKFLKSPLETDHEGVAKQIKLAFAVESGVLQRLGTHPRIVKYLGKRGNGLLFGEASHGNLQTYIDANNPSIELFQRQKWCYQSAQAVAYIHSCGVIHSDLRPENILVHETGPGILEPLLCDFGGAVCDELGLDGEQLPNDPFCHPALDFYTKVTTAVDIFSLGSIFYTILTGYWPYRTQAFYSSTDEYWDYLDRVALLFKQGMYPDVTGLVGGEVIKRCWTREFTTVQQILDALAKHMPLEGC
ncbi:kinase domain-containing protein [Sclerotinia borealis F-4128]|uniref:EKC/KEOPS complex subunit BUD32 n=1 Tax=Sclerotinia borealis (strain F-4128) TaxID=1432307 RepID=W9CGB0_SCLBF|nr:kinase domain-containing protein [Sclerotinia borealis F-4128]